MEILYFLVPYLACVLPIIFLCVKNIGEIKKEKIIKLIGLVSIGYSVIYFLITYFFEQTNHVSLILLIIIYLFFNLNALFTKELKSKLFVLCVLGVLVGVNFLSQEYIEIVFYILTCMLVFALVVLIYNAKVEYDKIVASRNAYKEEKVHTEEKHEPIIENSQEKLSVYYIVPDSYPSSIVLSKFFSYDNSEFDNWLKDKGFHVDYNAKCNYNITRLSLASTLNMDYLSNFFPYDENESDQVNIGKLTYMTYTSRVVAILKKMGYKYYHILNHWENEFMNSTLESADEQINVIKGSEFEKILLHKTLVGAFTDNISKRLVKLTHIKTFQELERIATKKELKFVYAHLICPHEPYCFNKEGEFPDNNFEDNLTNNSTGKTRELFLDQVYYLNIMLQNTITKILTDDPHSIIIIQADHGSYLPEAGESFDEEKITEKGLNTRFRPYRAIYAPKDFNYNFGGSSVNLFRAVINYLGGKLKYLPHESIFSTYAAYFKSKQISNKVFEKFEQENNLK